MSNISPGPYSYTYSPSNDSANKAIDTTRTGSATATLTYLSASLGLAAETCAKITMLNTGNAPLFVAANNGAAMPMFPSSSFAFNVYNTNLLQVSGSSTYAAVISR